MKKKDKNFAVVVSAAYRRVNDLWDSPDMKHLRGKLFHNRQDSCHCQSKLECLALIASLVKLV